MWQQYCMSLHLSEDLLQTLVVRGFHAHLLQFWYQTVNFHIAAWVCGVYVQYVMLCAGVSCFVSLLQCARILAHEDRGLRPGCMHWTVAQCTICCTKNLWDAHEPSWRVRKDDIVNLHVSWIMKLNMYMCNKSRSWTTTRSHNEYVRAILDMYMYMPQTHTLRGLFVTNKCHGTLCNKRTFAKVRKHFVNISQRFFCRILYLIKKLPQG